MNIGIIGAGAMGCLFASLLSSAHRVALYDISRSVVDTVNQNGVRILEQSGNVGTFYPSVWQNGRDTEEKELVILFVKATATRFSLAANRALFGEQTILLSLQNGMGNKEVIETFFPRERILLGTTKHNAVSTAPGEVFHAGAGATVIGSPSGNEGVAFRVTEAFRAAGIETEFSSDVKRLLWEKLFLNMTINPITALLGKKIGFVAGNEFSRALTRTLISEAVTVARADGEEFRTDELFRSVIHTAEILAEGKTSMCQDIEKKCPTEIDYINGAVVRLGQKYRIPVPTHEAIVRLIHAKEKSILEGQNL